MAQAPTAVHPEGHRPQILPPDARKSLGWLARIFSQGIDKTNVFLTVAQKKHRDTSPLIMYLYIYDTRCSHLSAIGALRLRWGYIRQRRRRTVLPANG